MEDHSKNELIVLSFQIGILLRLARLEKGMSQLDLATTLGTNPTIIGRIERAENFTSWDKIFLIAKELNVDLSSLFLLRNASELLGLVDRSFLLEQKLTNEKTHYYKYLKEEIAKAYKLLNIKDA